MKKILKHFGIVYWLCVFAMATAFALFYPFKSPTIAPEATVESGQCCDKGYYQSYTGQCYDISSYHD